MSICGRHNIPSYCWGLFPLVMVLCGCYHPYTYSPYQQPYGAPAYGQPPMGQPIMQGYPPGTVVPNQGTASPPISSVPTDQNWQAPSPGPNGSNGNNAPKFDPNNSGNNEPKVPNPYFEGASLPRNTFVPEGKTASIEQAGFSQTTAKTPLVESPKVVQRATFQPPVIHNTPSTPTKSAQPIHNNKKNEAVPFNPFDAFSKPKPLNSEMPLPPPAAVKVKKNIAPSDSLEGIVRLVSENEWVLEFAKTTDPFGGKLPLTGAPEVIKLLKDGRRYRLQGVIESQATNPGSSQLRVIRAEALQSVGSPFPSAP